LRESTVFEYKRIEPSLEDIFIALVSRKEVVNAA
jgi:hypothetical protein